MEPVSTTVVGLVAAHRAFDKAHPIIARLVHKAAGQAVKGAAKAVVETAKSNKKP